jgi:hypothetical protein
MRKIGLIAGGGQFPLLLARAAKSQGVQVVAVAFREETDRRLEEEVDLCAWVALGKLGQMIEVFRKAEVHEAVMAGTVAKTKLYSKLRPDWKVVKLLARLIHKKDDALLRATAEELEANGIKIRPSTLFLPELLAPPGILTRRRPTARERRDIAFGWTLAKEIGNLDIGQCLVVKDQAVLAVEAMEGTDETIERGGRLSQGQAVVVKVSKPGQDLRFDVPAVGLQTVETMEKAGASVLVVEAGRTLIFDRDRMIDAADRARIAILSLSSAEGMEEVKDQLVDGPGGFEPRTVGIPRVLRVVVSPQAPRVAVVGAGYLGQFHAEKYAALEEAHLVAVADLDLARAQQVAERCSCQAFSSHRDLIGKVDAVSVVVPPQNHYLVAREFVEAGIHVLVEKPMTVSLEEADAIIALARARGLILQVGHLERFNPAVLAARPYIRQPLFLESHRLASFSERGTEVNVILDLMIHDIDIILSLVPYPLEDLRAVGVTVLTQTTDIASVRLEFTSGCIANVTASRISANKMRKIRIFQPDSYLSIDYADKEVELYHKLQSRDSNGFPEIEYERLPVADTDPLEEELRAFMHSVRTGQRPVVGGEEGRAALEVAIRVSELIRERMEQLGAAYGLR